MDNIKKRQHYVFRAYLKAWSKDEKIWCRRHDKVYPSNLMGVAQEKYFYRLKEITEEQVRAIKKLFLDDADPIVQSMNQWWIDTYMLLFRMRREISKQIEYTEEMEREYYKAITNLEEELQSHTEHLGLPYLAMLREGDYAFYSTAEGNSNFNLYLTAQYLRTKNMKIRFINHMRRMDRDLPQFSGFMNQLTNGDPEGIWSIVRYISATNIVATLFIQREDHELVLLKNETELNFITGDQPVINTFATGLSDVQVPEKLELYYPLTPKSALLIREKDGSNRVEFSLTEERVRAYNNMIIEHSYEQIFGSSEEDVSIAANSE